MYEYTMAAEAEEIDIQPLCFTAILSNNEHFGAVCDYAHCFSSHGIKIDVTTVKRKKQADMNGVPQQMERTYSWGPVAPCSRQRLLSPTLDQMVACDAYMHLLPREAKKRSKSNLVKQAYQ
eukprot:TRINITY_DN66529_c0_g1_i1.p1 TRINITY_DN66529_c0_g1~~TRINITY_DN66529_c0_g1_i1.p1  ORF type:complete len:121 (+),score=11.59 TRINITY_DN66529_c0_g1_i1:103-465(+)